LEPIKLNPSVASAWDDIKEPSIAKPMVSRKEIQIAPAPNITHLDLDSLAYFSRRHRPAMEEVEETVENDEEERFEPSDLDFDPWAESAMGLADLLLNPEKDPTENSQNFDSSFYFDTPARNAASAPAVDRSSQSSKAIRSRFGFAQGSDAISTLLTITFLISSSCIQPNTFSRR